MKKRILILAAVAISGLAAVVASNVNMALAADRAECMSAIENYNGTNKCCAYVDYLTPKCYIVVFGEGVWCEHSELSKVDN